MLPDKIFSQNRTWFVILLIFISCLSGCFASTKDIPTDEAIHYDESYDFSDKKIIVDKLAASLLSKPPLVATYDRPVVIVYGIANRTSEHITTNIISDEIRQKLIESGKARFINEKQRGNIQKEIDIQYSGTVNPDERVKEAKQAGAKYMLTGTLYSIEKKEPKQIRLNKKILNYYNLVLELTDIETGIIEWTDKVELARESSKPVIGW